MSSIGIHDKKSWEFSRRLDLWGSRWNFKKLITFVLIVSCCFQNLILVDFGSFALKPFHLLGLFALLYTVWEKKVNWTVPSSLFVFGVVAALGISLIGYMRFGVNSVVFNYSFMLVICCTFYNLGSDYSLKDWECLFRLAASFVMCAIFIKLLLNLDAIALFRSQPWMGHPVLPTFFGGGVNLEASWMALFIPFFGWNLTGLLYIILALLLSFIYASRAGLMLAVLGVAYVFLGKYKGAPMKTKLMVLTGILVAGFVVLVLQGNALIERFLSIGTDPGSEGRFNMWRYAALAFKDAPMFGCGAGNATRHIDMLMPSAGILEDNVHMYPMQVLLDFGSVGAVIFAFFVISFIKRCYKNRLRSPFEAWLLFYLIASFVQFRGADVLLGVCLAGYFLRYGSREVE